MATAKKSPVSKKKPASVTKKAPSRQVKARVSTKTAKSVRSLRPTENTTPFMQTRFTVQSLYWVILGAVVIAFGLWLASLQMEINKIYDQIDRNQAQSQLLDAKKPVKR
jgi:hypothetical protein